MQQGACSIFAQIPKGPSIHTYTAPARISLLIWSVPLVAAGAVLQPLSSSAGGEWEMWRKWRCGGSLHLVWLGCVVQVQPSFPPAGFLFACSLSVFIYGLHLARLSACCSPAAVLSSCWISISLRDALWSDCEKGVFYHEEPFIGELLHSNIFCTANEDCCEWNVFTRADVSHQLKSIRIINVQFWD